MFGRGDIELHWLFKSKNVQTQAEMPSRPAHQSLSRRGAICPTQKAWNSGASSQTCELGFGRRDIVLAALTVKSKNVDVPAEMQTTGFGILALMQKGGGCRLLNAGFWGQPKPDRNKER